MDQIREKIKEVRYKTIDKKADRKADLFVGQWLNLKVGVTQNSSLRILKREQKNLNKFFTQKGIQTLLDENRELSEQVIFENILDSARIYQNACATDPNYGSKLFNLMKMKSDEVANKAGDEVYGIVVPALLKMDNLFWRNQMLATIHLAYQEVFGKEANKAELYFSDRQEFENFDNIVNKTLQQYTMPIVHQAE